MAEARHRPTRPSARLDNTAALAKKFLGEESARISIRVSQATHKAIKRAAKAAGKNQKQWLMDLARAAGAEIAPVDLTEDGDD